MVESDENQDHSKGTGGAEVDEEFAGELSDSMKSISSDTEKIFRQITEYDKRFTQIWTFIIFGTFFAAWWGAKDEISLSLYPLAGMLIAASLIAADMVKEMIQRFRLRWKSARESEYGPQPRDFITEFSLQLVALIIAFVALMWLATEIVIEATQEPGTEPRIETAAGPEAAEDQMLARF